MMQAADLRNRNHLTTVPWLNIACNWRVSIQREARPCVMIILEVVARNSTKMSLVEHDDMIEALATDGTDQPLNERILPGRSRRGDP